MCRLNMMSGERRCAVANQALQLAADKYATSLGLVADGSLRFTQVAEAYEAGYAAAAPQHQALGVPAEDDEMLAEFKEWFEEVGKEELKAAQHSLEKHSLGGQASAVEWILTDLPTLLVRVSASPSPVPLGGGPGWVSLADAQPEVPEGQTRRVWVCVNGEVGELHFGNRVEMDENWDDDEPFTGWFLEGDEDGQPVYRGPKPSHFRYQETPPAAPTQEPRKEVAGRDEVNTFCEKLGNICTDTYCDNNGCNLRKRGNGSQAADAVAGEGGADAS